ncbi:hypothetical protein [Brevundimonas naejangsanensis]|uniref:hypothetical protein n=1 Tax=Brevundimonas naejangsanensis TaxID=588932 RepID=UPI0025EC96DE|nr:hypothetical protein [Brevundimonas naejangsanensis]
MAASEIPERRFQALAGYTRDYRTIAFLQEFAWFESDDGRVLGVQMWDRFDRDFGWLALGRDERGRFRAIDVNSSLVTPEAARDELLAAMDRWQSEPDDAMHQGLDDDEEELLAAVDFFAPLTPEADQHPSFKVLLNDPRYSPAREMIAAMMRYHVDVDGNFIQQFQTVAFDTRLWELYLFAVFTELGFARMGEHAAPDFVMTSLRGGMGVEATTANPPDDGEAPRPKTRDEALAYMENYVPIKLARALKKKLKKKTPYWEQPGMEGLPFAIALQDFHAPGSMTTVARTATEYVFGVRHSMRGQTRHIEWIETHAYGTSSEPSGFFKLKDADHVSAVLVNPQGTLVKFNRLGLMAGFGDPRVRMVRSGIRRHDGDADPRPRPFTDEVHAAGYEESWVEGLVVLHNPGAQRPLDPDLLPGATHEYLEPDGRIMSALPDSPPPYFARTAVFLDGQTVEEPDVQND